MNQDATFYLDKALLNLNNALAQIEAKNPDFVVPAEREAVANDIDDAIEEVNNALTGIAERTL